MDRNGCACAVAAAVQCGTWWGGIVVGCVLDQDQRLQPTHTSTEPNLTTCKSLQTTHEGNGTAQAPCSRTYSESREYIAFFAYTSTPANTFKGGGSNGCAATGTVFPTMLCAPLKTRLMTYFVSIFPHMIYPAAVRAPWSKSALTTAARSGVFATIV